MTASSPKYKGISLTDELAEATNELLSLGGRQLGKAPDSTCLTTLSPPLLTPSPLNLSAGGPTLSSLMAISRSSRLILINDDDEHSTTNAARSEEAISSSDTEDASNTIDADDHFPSSQLNRLVAPVFSTSTGSIGIASSPRLSLEKERTIVNKAGTSHLHSFDEEASPRTNHTPTFFVESFPHAREESSTAPTSSSNGKIGPPASLHLAMSQPAPATLSNVGEATVIVKLYGNERLEREARGRTKEEPDDEMSPSLQRSDSLLEHMDDGDQSSLLSLAATALTTSSQASSKARRRLVRRRSGGSTSVVTEEIDVTEDTPFARDVQIRGFTAVGEKSRGFVCYDVRVITVRGTTISILRRFSSFCQLRQSLLSERPQHAKLIPPLPPRRTGLFQKYASHHLEKRRRALQKWLAIIMLDRRWATTKSLREWVVGSSDEM